jgi:hypothetical protein
MAARQRQHPPPGARLLVDGVLPEGVVQRLCLTVVGQLVAAHGQHALGRALEQQVVASRCVLGRRVGGGHVAVFRLERNGPGARALTRQLLRVDAGLHRQGQQSAFGRVAGQLPQPVLKVQAGVVAQGGGLGQRQQHRRLAEQLGWLQVVAVAPQRALGRVARPLHIHQPPASTTCCTVISLRVRVPVLSEQITVTEPSVSTAGRRRITAWRAAMRCTPMARVMDMMAGSLREWRPPPGHGGHEHLGRRHAAHQVPKANSAAAAATTAR